MQCNILDQTNLLFTWSLRICAKRCSFSHLPFYLSDLATFWFAALFYSMAYILCFPLLLPLQLTLTRELNPWCRDDGIRRVWVSLMAGRAPLLSVPGSPSISSTRLGAVLPGTSVLSVSQPGSRRPRHPCCCCTALLWPPCVPQEEAENTKLLTSARVTLNIKP